MLSLSPALSPQDNVNSPCWVIGQHPVLCTDRLIVYPCLPLFGGPENRRAWQFDRYFSRDRKMLGWDRTVGNMHEQMGPFLTLFWANIWLAPYGGALPHEYVAALGWIYVLLRCFYPVRGCLQLSRRFTLDRGILFLCMALHMYVATSCWV